MPSNVLIADRNNNRLIAVTPTGQVVYTLKESAPSDAYLSPTGLTVAVTQHVQSTVLLRRVNSGAVAYRYGHTGHVGSSDNYLHDPQTAQYTPNGHVVIADLGNCRVLEVAPPSHKPVRTLGTPGQCNHHVNSPPLAFAHPDAAFPTTGGGLVVTELNPAWVDVLTKNGTLSSAIQLTGFTAPYDANEYAGGDLIVTDRAHPGKVVEFSPTGGAPLWTYGPTSGAGELDRPTLAIVLPNGDVMVADSGNDRVIVIDRASQKIVWQYGRTHVAGQHARAAAHARQRHAGSVGLSACARRLLIPAAPISPPIASSAAAIAIPSLKLESDAALAASAIACRCAAGNPPSGGTPSTR